MKAIVWYNYLFTDGMMESVRGKGYSARQLAALESSHGKLIRSWIERE